MQLIKNNPYRIVGLLVGAKAKVQDRQIRRLKQIIDAEQEPEDDFSFPKLGKLNRTIDVVNDAASKLNLDNDKMDAALFWFYNGNEITDEPAFNLLKDGKIKETAAIWTKLVNDKPVESKNASAFQNLSTLLLNHAIKDDIIKENLFEDGIWLKLKFLESDFVKDLKALATDETYRTTKKKLQLLFLNQVQSEIEKHGGITTNKFIEILNRQEFIAKEDFLKGFVQKPIEQIESKIEEAKSKRKANKAYGVIAGKILFESTSENISLLKSILGISSINFSSISDRVSDEILQCGIDYYLHFRDTNTDPGSASMDLFCNAETLAIGKIAKQRCQENIQNLKIWIKENQILPDINYITNEIKEPSTHLQTIDWVKKILKNINPRLNNIKIILGDTHVLYLSIRDSAISKCVGMLVSVVNKIQKQGYSGNELLRQLISANEMMKEILEYEMSTDIRENLKKNIKTLDNIISQISLNVQFKKMEVTDSVKLFFYTLGVVAVLLLFAYLIFGEEGFYIVLFLGGLPLSGTFIQLVKKFFNQY